jgi:asparagine synthetase B (glutamine-hydrolysing)
VASWPYPQQRTLFYTCDRFGVRYFYYYFYGKRLLFASEIEAILEVDFVSGVPIDRTVRDYRLVEYCFTLPWSQKIRHGTTRYIQRQAMEGILPESIIRRQDKIGFSTPEDSWFRSDLKDDFRHILDSESFRSRPYFRDIKVEEAWDAHQAGKIDNAVRIWRWVNFEMWLRQFVDSPRKEPPQN